MVDIEKKAYLPKIYGTALVQSLCGKHFVHNSCLNALSGSQVFFSEIYELFLRLNSCGIGTAALFSILDKTDIAIQDKKRLELIFAVYADLNEKIESSNYHMPKIEPKMPHKTPEEFPDLTNLNLWAKQTAGGFKNRAYIQFDDPQSEAVFIAKEIKNFVQNGFGNWGDFGIFITDTGLKHTLIEIFNALSVPTNYSELSENFVRFRVKLEQFLNICELGECEETNLILDNLRPKPEDLSAICEFYKNADYTKIISHLAAIEKIDGERSERNENEVFDFRVSEPKNHRFYETEINKAVWAITNFCRNVINERPQNALIISVVDNVLYNGRAAAKNSVTIFSNTAAGGKTFKALYVPGLIETAFTNKEYIYFISQKTNAEISEQIRKITPDFGEIIPGTGANLNIEKFSDVLKLSTHSAILSTFNYFETKQISPSVIFDLFKNVDSQNFKKIDASVQFGTEIEIKPEEAYAEGQNNEAIIGENEILKLNPSAISNFQNCPKKYFFKNLLKLKEQNDFLASYGSIAHAVLEVFNRNFGGQGSEKYNSREMLKLCDTLFLAKISPENAENALEIGFKETDVELVRLSDDMALAQMKDNFYDAVLNLVEAGFFNNPPIEVQSEIKFEFELPEIKNVIFDGRIDCIQKSKGDESFSVIDYKTGKDKKKPLSYYASEFGVNFQGDYRQYAGKFNEKLINEYQYQIPVYYLGAQYAQSLSKFKGETEKFMLEYIRPKSLDGGYKQDAVSKTELGTVKEKIIQNLKEKVVDAIRGESEFSPKPELRKCLNCSYSFLCDGIDLLDDALGAEDAQDD